MANVSKRVTMVNPGNKRKKRRNLSPLQIKFFGTKRQKAALKRRNGGSRIRRKQGKKGFASLGKSKSATRFIKSSSTGRRSKSRGTHKRLRAGLGPRKNVSRILTLSLPNGRSSKRKRRTVSHRRKRSNGIASTSIKTISGLFGKSKSKSKGNRKVSNMARRKRKSVSSRRRVTRRRRTNPAVTRRRRRYSRRRNPAVVTRRRYSRRRRNPGIRTSNPVIKIGGILGGAAVTGLLSSMLPAGLRSGILGYVSTGVVAYAQGKMIGKVTKNRSLGDSMVTGGLVFLGLKVIGDMFPSIGQYIPFSLRGGRGMGIIGGSSFYTPQVPLPGTMSQFVLPSAVPRAVPVQAGMRGLGTVSVNQGSVASIRRTGRVA